MHEHFAADGAPCSAAEAHRTIVTREAEWDEETRERATRLEEYESHLCRCGCELPVEVAHDPKQAFLVDTMRCTAGRAIGREKRRLAKLHEDDEDAAWADGLFFYAEPSDAPPPTTRPSPIQRAKEAK